MTHLRSTLCLLLLTSIPALAQEHLDPPLERGFMPDKAFMSADIDHVDLFSCASSLTIPVGQAYPVGGGFSYSFKLVYHSDVWDMRTETLTTGPGATYTYTVARPNHLSNAGMGWMLTLGTLIDLKDPDNISGDWRYVAPDGAQHEFFESMYGPSWLGGSPGVWYTRDDSYLRMTENDPYRTVEFPDGTWQVFEQDPSNSLKWRLTVTQDRFGNWMQVNYGTDTSGNTLWTITDSLGRTHYVDFNQHGHVASVQLRGFKHPGQPWPQVMTYTFSYQFPVVQRNCQDDDPNTSEFLNTNPSVPGGDTWPFLTMLTLPDGSHYQMFDYASGPSYYTTCNADDQSPHPRLGPESGVLNKIMLPTGGGIGWQMQTYQYHSIDDEIDTGQDGWVDITTDLFWAGVYTRSLLDSSGNVLPGQTWTYQTGYGWCPNCSSSSPLAVWEERTTVVTNPDGNDTVHYFRAYPSSSSIQLAMWDYALPYTRRVQDPDGSARFLSEEYFQGSYATGTKVRTVYRQFEWDPWPGYGDAPYRHTNRRMASERTVYHDDGERFIRTVNADNDGVGHYRTTIIDASSDFGPSKTTFVGYNPTSPGNYLDFPNNTYPQPSWPWLLNTYDARHQTEAGVTAGSEYCFERDPTSGYPTTGLLLAKRVLINGTAEGAHDLLATYSRNSHGDVSSEQYFGGDTQTIGTSGVCAAVTVQPTYRIDHVYQDGSHPYGSLWRSYYVDPATGSPLSFYLADDDIDLTSGLLAAARHLSGPATAGIATTFDYDSSDRLISIQPDPSAGARTQVAYHIYDPGSGYSNPEANVTRTPNDGSSTVLTQQRYIYDGFARVVAEKGLLPDSSCTSAPCWNQRLTTYDAMGRKASVSEVQPDGTSGNAVKWTTFQYDLFGRQKVITPPDGASHAVTFDYLGARQTTSHAYVATSQGAESSVARTEIHDLQGRLWQVTEPSGSGGAQVATTYTYDVGNRITQVNIGGAQTRTFAYDNRGFLNSEGIPEAGTAGNGTITYSNYDARGHIGRKQDGVNDLTFAYDRAERLTDVYQVGITTALKHFDFASANASGDWANGKLRSSTITDPSSDGTATVTETFTYGGIGGAVSQKTTQIALSGSTTGDFSKAFTQSYTWTDLGKVASIAYPGLGGVAPDRTVYESYSNGALTAILPGYTTSITYFPNGLAATIVHGNGVADVRQLDPNAMARPYQISSSGAKLNGQAGAGDWSTGAYAYDGSGNIKAMGGDTFTFDGVSRLASASLTAAGTPHSESYGYDQFGNMTSVTTDGAARSQSIAGVTNRLSSSTYDAAGNMTSWNAGGYTYTATYTHLDMMASVSGFGINRLLAYDAGGERTLIRDRNASPLAYAISLRGLDGKLLREMSYTPSSQSWAWKKDYVYRGAALLASVSAGEGTRHYALDHLGTPRLVTNRCGERIDQFSTFPFGQEIVTGTQDGTEKLRFTGQERDLFSLDRTYDDIDYMHARYDSPYLARFFSLDPVQGDPTHPLSWNRYSYAANNPLKFIDPTGMANGNVGTGPQCGPEDSLCASSLAVSTENQANGTAQSHSHKQAPVLSQQLLLRLTTDQLARKAFEAYRDTKLGKKQQQDWQHDPDTQYIMTVGRTRNNKGEETHGNTNPTKYREGYDPTKPGEKFNAQEVTMTINIDFTETQFQAGGENRVEFELADSFGHEGMHASDYGLGILGWGEARKHGGEIDRQEDPEYLEFQKELLKVFPY